MRHKETESSSSCAALLLEQMVAQQRRQRLEKFRAEHFRTPPADISQLAADGMIVVIDLEALVRELKTTIEALQQHVETERSLRARDAGARLDAEEHARALQQELDKLRGVPAKVCK